MSFDWSQYLNLAQELAGKPQKPASREAKFRSAISRAYYAVFSIARNHLHFKEGLVIPSKDVHWYVIHQFKNSPDNFRREIGRSLDRLRRQRNMADYDNNVRDLAGIARSSLKVAEQVINNLAKL